jgi:hypothetical protein
VDARRAPSRVLGDHAEDQIPYLLGGLFSPTVPPDSRNQPPIKTKADSVPTDHCFRRDDDEGLLPTGPDSPSNCPEEPVEAAKARAWMVPFQHDKLLAQGQVFEEETSMRTSHGGSWGIYSS